jgi:hypothetical protein
VTALRGVANARPSPGPFHCVACKSYVTGTPSGHCPRCGWVPPSAPAVPRQARSRAPLRTVAVLAIAAIALWRLLA